MAEGNSGPTGSGLIPPVTEEAPPVTTIVVANMDQEPDEDTEDDLTDQQLLDEADDNDLLSDEPGDDDPLETRFRQFEADQQRRFDRAVTRAVRRAQRQNNGASAESDEDEDERPAGENARQEPPKRRSTSRQVDVRSIRVLARDRIADEMETMGSNERKVVKAVLDQVIPLIDWNNVEEDDVVDDLVTVMKGAATTLVKTGAERKVRQLQRKGLAPEGLQQPGTSPTGRGTRPLSTQMGKGAQVAQQRWPEGRRRMGQ